MIVEQINLNIGRIVAVSGTATGYGNLQGVILDNATPIGPVDYYTVRTAEGDFFVAEHFITT